MGTHKSVPQITHLGNLHGTETNVTSKFRDNNYFEHVVCPYYEALYINHFLWTNINVYKTFEGHIFLIELRQEMEKNKIYIPYPYTRTSGIHWDDRARLFYLS